MPVQWAARVTAPANHIDDDTLTSIVQQINATLSVDAATKVLTASYEVTAQTLRQAIDQALQIARALPAKPTSLRVLPLDDWMREQEAPGRQDLVGSTEAARLLGVSRQRVGQLAERPDFPAPIARISAGPIWTRASVVAFNERWGRKITGRPRKAASA
jgi:hypothetical protein